MVHLNIKISNSLKTNCPHYTSVVITAVIFQLFLVVYGQVINLYISKWNTGVYGGAQLYILQLMLPPCILFLTTTIISMDRRWNRMDFLSVA